MNTIPEDTDNRVSPQNDEALRRAISMGTTREAIASTAGFGSKACAWMLALSIVGYPVASIISTTYGYQDRTITLPFRMMVLSLAVLIVVFGLRKSAPRAAMVGLLTIAGLYLIRVWYDATIIQLPITGENLKVYGAAAAIPMLAIAFGPRPDRVNFSFALALLGCITVAFMSLLVMTGSEIETAAMVESGDLRQGERLGTHKLNPILLGHTAVAAMIGIYAYMRLGRSLFFKAAFIMMLPFCIFILVSSNSRGPMAAFFVLFVLLVVRERRVWPIGLFFVTVVLTLTLMDTTTIVDRFMATTQEDESALQRVRFLQLIFYEPIEWFLVGRGSVDLDLFANFHNFTVDSLMSLGLFAGLAFHVIVLMALRSAWLYDGVNRGGPIFFALIHQLVFVQFSGGLSINTAFWLMVAASIRIGENRQKVRRR